MAWLSVIDAASRVSQVLAPDAPCPCCHTASWSQHKNKHHCVIIADISVAYVAELVTRSRVQLPCLHSVITATQRTKRPSISPILPSHI